MQKASYTSSTPETWEVTVCVWALLVAMHMLAALLDTSTMHDVWQTISTFH